MSKHLTEILIDKGYKTYRYIGDSFKEDISKNFSSMQEGGLRVFYVLNEDFDNPIIWGLNEGNKPPTLIRPRPNIKLKTNENHGFKPLITSKKQSTVFFLNQEMDDIMNHCLQQENHEDILKAMFDKTIIFEYDLTKKHEQA